MGRVCGKCHGQVTFWIKWFFKDEKHEKSRKRGFKVACYAKIFDKKGFSCHNREVICLMPSAGGAA